MDILALVFCIKGQEEPCWTRQNTYLVQYPFSHSDQYMGGQQNPWQMMSLLLVYMIHPQRAWRLNAGPTALTYRLLLESGDSQPSLLFFERTFLSSDIHLKHMTTVCIKTVQHQKISKYGIPVNTNKIQIVSFALDSFQVPIICGLFSLQSLLWNKPNILTFKYCLANICHGSID